jgi:Protein of unknwon function (DUF3310)
MKYQDRGAVRFDPYTGNPVTGTGQYGYYSAESWRLETIAEKGGVAWEFNPYTGCARTMLGMQNDPYCHWLDDTWCEAGGQMLSDGESKANIEKLRAKRMVHDIYGHPLTDTRLEEFMVRKADVLSDEARERLLAEMSCATPPATGHKEHDPVDHPSHYTAHPSGVECIQITEHMGFNLGNAIKYVWRADLKSNSSEDLAKAAWYIQREIERRKGAK